MAEQQDESQSLEAHFVNFAQVILTRLASWAASEGIPQDRHHRVFFWEHDWHEHVEVKDDYRTLLMSHFTPENIWMLEEADQCARRHWEAGLPHFLQMPQLAPTPGALLTFEEARQAIVYQLLRPIIDVVEQDHTFQPTHEHLLQSYERFRVGWTTSTIPFDSSVPLVNFTCDLEIEAIPGTPFQVDWFTPEEKTEIWDSHAFTLRRPTPSQSERPLDIRALGHTDYKLASSRTYTLGEQMSIGDLLANITSLLTALRLTKAGDVGALTLFEKADVTSLWENVIHNVPLEDFRTRYPGSVYALKAMDLPTVQTLFESLKWLSKQKHQAGLGVALRRFNQSYTRDIPEDRVIDLTIALESCLLAMPDTKTELRYRFALRGAALLAQSRAPRATKKMLLALYDARSAIVHAGKQLSQVEDLAGRSQDEFPKACEDIARDILKQYLFRKKHVEAVNTDLENLIVDSLAPQED